MQNNKAIYKRKVKTDPDLWLKRGVWIYFFLIIFEGALRKWVLPAAATPLLIVRDPVAIWLIYKIWNRGDLPSSPYLKVMVWLTIISVFTALIFGHGNLLVALFGARVFLIHFPLIWVIGRIFDRDDVLDMGRALLWMALPMAVLIALQFYSPQTSFVNRGIGGDLAGGGFSGANGFFRPPGTFSFTNGTHLFFALTGSFLFYFWLNPKGTNKLLMYAATIALIAAIPLSISRSLTFFLGVILIFMMVSVVRKPANLMRMIFAIVGFALVLLILSKVSFFQTATDAFFQRFTNAADSEGGLNGTLGDRYIGLMVKAVSNSAEQPFFGYGLGMGTNVGSMLLTGSRTFLISEEEWGRVIGEMGTLIGLSVIFIRVALSVKMFIASYFRMVKGDMLPWMLVSYGLLLIPQGQWAQPTNLGFSILIGGLIFASMNGKTRDIAEGAEDKTKLTDTQPLAVKQYLKPA
ncbi:hypothetical protein [Pedobacter sp. L105]|uniref:hypothetical protein n=1 Tax=Pedobacter sp. L105 TaxID=1641871 RepID=UPI001C204B7F|nr:hypothetical protein [Pedobacter sp. L105]